MTVTVTKVERDIRGLEQRLHFLRQLLDYLRNGTAPAAEGVPEIELAAASTPTRMGIQANLLRKLSEGAAYPEDLMKWFRTDQRKSVLNALGLLRRADFIRDTTKGRVELTTAGIEQAQWFVANPTLVKRMGPRKGKKSNA